MRLAAGEYDLGDESLWLRTEGLRLLGEEGVAITRAIDDECVVYVEAEGVVIERVAIETVAIRPAEGIDCDAVVVTKGSATVKDCDLGGPVSDGVGAELLLQKRKVHDVASAVAAVVVSGSVVIQDCILQDSPEANGIHVVPTGEAMVTNTTIRRCDGQGHDRQGSLLHHRLHAQRRLGWRRALAWSASATTPPTPRTRAKSSHGTAARSRASPRRSSRNSGGSEVE